MISNLPQLALTGATATIRLDAFADNLQRLRDFAPKCKVWAVVKANAYGHGLGQVAPYLAKHVEGFAVARLEEALALRAIGITAPILLLEGFIYAEHLAQIANHQIQVAIHHRYQLEALVAARISRPIQVWFKVDTGMHRLGLAPEEVASCLALAKSSSNINQSINVMSHFARADEVDCAASQTQIACFEGLLPAFDGERAMANSAGIMAWPAAHYDWIRPGIAMYGVSPFEDKTGSELGLRPVMQFCAPLIAIRQHAAGVPIGYGGGYVAPSATTIGVVAAGYADGYPRTVPSGTPVWLNGRYVPIVGRVSMDMLTVDLGVDSCDHIGDEVQLWGDKVAVEQVAHSVGTIGYELLTKITSRVHFRYQGGSAHVVV